MAQSPLQQGAVVHCLFLSFCFEFLHVASSHLFASITFSKEGAPHQNFFVGRSEGGGAVFFISKNLPLKGKFFEMVSWGGLGGFCPPQESRSGGLRPLRNLRYLCLAPAAAVPCPQFFFVQNVSSNFFSSEFFSSVVGPSSVRPSSVRRPSVRRPSVRKAVGKY